MCHLTELTARVSFWAISGPDRPCARSAKISRSRRVSGATRLLGQHRIRAVHNQHPQAEIRLLVRGHGVPPLSNDILARTRLIRGDLTQPESYAAAMRGVETVIHSAEMNSLKKVDRRTIN